MVLFIDEPVRLIENKMFPKDGDDDRYAHLRQTILGESVGKVFNTSLVMTSLNVSVFGITDSGRRIIPVVLASKLSVDHIVDKIWIPFFHASSPLLNLPERAILKWLAASVSAAPRLVEIMGTALQEEFANTWSGSSRGLTLRQSMGAVLSAFVELQNSCYLPVPFPVGKYLHALINDEAIDVDFTMLQYVRSSTFTNSITQFPNERTKPVLVPESALCFLASATEVVSNDIIAKEIQKEFKAIWGNLLGHITSPESSPLGQQPLEDVFTSILRIRILSSHLKEGSSSGQTTIKDLLAIKDLSLIKYTIGGAPYKAAKISNSGKSVTPDGVQKTFMEWEADTFEYVVQGKNVAKRDTLEDLLLRKIIAPTRVDIMKLASSRNLFAWKEAIRSINSKLVLEIPAPNNDHCDLMMFFRMLASGTTSPPPTKVGSDEIVLVFEEKSKGENNDSNEIWWGYFTQKDGEKEKGPYDQHDKFCKAVASITESDLEGDTGGYYLRALKEGRFIYVYVTTHGGPTVHLTAQDLPGMECNSLGVLVLNREVTKRILGPIFDVYACAVARIASEEL
eukprot:gene22916-biopygen15191